MQKDNILVPPVPITNDKEMEKLDILTERYNKLIEPSKLAKVGSKVGQLIPEGVKTWGKGIGLSVSEMKLYMQMMDVIGRD